MLYIVATPIGDHSEISLRAIETLNRVETIIVESTKEASKLLRSLKISGKKFEILNEHTNETALSDLIKLCKTQDMALISDCGTPGFCDPGPLLISRCRRLQIPVQSVLGPSALMGLLSLSGQRIDQFLFRGFLPAESESRKRELKILSQEKRAIILMDTPYRMKKTLQEMSDFFSEREFLLVTDLSQENEVVLEGPIERIRSRLKKDKAEFMLLIYPK